MALILALSSCFKSGLVFPQHSSRSSCWATTILIDPKSVLEDLSSGSETLTQPLNIVFREDRAAISHVHHFQSVAFDVQQHSASDGERGRICTTTMPYAARFCVKILLNVSRWCPSYSMLNVLHCALIWASMYVGHWAMCRTKKNYARVDSGFDFAQTTPLCTR